MDLITSLDENLEHVAALYDFQVNLYTEIQQENKQQVDEDVFYVDSITCNEHQNSQQECTDLNYCEWNPGKVYGGTCQIQEPIVEQLIKELDQYLNIGSINVNSANLFSY